MVSNNEQINASTHWPPTAVGGWPVVYLHIPLAHAFLCIYSVGLVTA